MNKNHDKYLLICGFSFIIIFSFAFMYNSTDSDDEDIIGVVTSISKTDSGFLFDFEDYSGKQYHCFSKTELNNNSIYDISGNYSKDGSIFFVEQSKAIRMM